MVCMHIYYPQGTFRHPLGSVCTGKWGGGRGVSLQYLQGLKLGINEVKGYHMWKRHWEGAASF